MLAFENAEIFLKHSRGSLNQFMGNEHAGEKFKTECPICRKETYLKITKEGNGKCMVCGTHINIEWEI